MTGHDGGLEGLRRANRLQVLELLLSSGPMRQADIARTTQLSTSTISAIISKAREQGLVIDVGDGERSPELSRRGQLISLNFALGYLVGVEIGQSATRVAVSDLSHRIIAQESVEHIVNEESTRAADSIFETAQRLIDMNGIDRARIVGVGVGMPSPMDETHRTIDSLQVFPGWTGERVSQELSQRFDKPVFVENDADAGALAEYRWGAGRGAENLIYVLTSGGIGAGIILHGSIHRGVTRSAGEIGHVSVDRDGALCYCGNRGCLQTVAGGDALVNSLRPFLGSEVTLEEVAVAASRGDRTAARALHDAGRHIGHVLAQLTNILNPDRIVIGGLFLPAGEVFLTPLREELFAGTIRVASNVTVVPSELAGISSVRAVLGIIPVDVESLVNT